MIDKSTFSDRKALFHTFGCKLNFAETSTVAKMLAGRGIISAREGETPDIIVVNTCSVTELADKKCRQAIRAFNRRYPAAAIVVTGCYAQLKAPDIEKMPGVVIVAGNDRKLEIADAVERWLDRREPVLLHTPVKDIRSFSPSCARGDRTRFFLKFRTDAIISAPIAPFRMPADAAVRPPSILSWRKRRAPQPKAVKRL